MSRFKVQVSASPVEKRTEGAASKVSTDALIITGTITITMKITMTITITITMAITTTTITT